MAFNVAVFTYLVYHLLFIARQPIERQKKIIIITCGVVLLIAPIAMIVGLIPGIAYLFFGVPSGNFSADFSNQTNLKGSDEELVTI